MSLPCPRGSTGSITGTASWLHHPHPVPVPTLQQHGGSVGGDTATEETLVPTLVERGMAQVPSVDLESSYPLFWGAEQKEIGCLHQQWPQTDIPQEATSLPCPQPSSIRGELRQQEWGPFSSPAERGWAPTAGSSLNLGHGVLSNFGSQLWGFTGNSKEDDHTPYQTAACLACDPILTAQEHQN